MALTDKLIAIANAIRNKTNTTEIMTLDEMPSKIENIISEVNPILQDKSVTITENGTTNIAADEGYNGLNKVEVTTNVAGGVEFAEANIFVQEDEPELKRGLWLKTNEYSVQEIHVANENNTEYSGGGWDADGTHIQLPHHNGYACATAVDTIMYYCGGQDAFAQHLYAYDTVANNYRKLTNIPYMFGWGGFCALDNYLYFFGGKYAATTAYKYDIANDSYTKLTDVPVGFVSAIATPLNGKIYLITGRPNANSSTRYNTIYEYDPATDTYRLANATIHNGDCKGAVGFGDSIYIFGSDQAKTTCYKYNPTTDTSTQMNNIPFSCVDTYACATNDAIYLVGSSGSPYALWKYNPFEDSYTQLTNVPYSTWGPASGALINDKQIFAIGDTTNHFRVQVYNIPRTIYNNVPNNCILIDQNGKGLKTIFCSEIESYFGAVLYYLDGIQMSDIEIYYGTDSEWRKIN